jgi:uncharacterized protein YlaI
VESVRAVACVGCGLLQVRIDGEWTDLLSFSNAFSDRFHKVSRRLDIRCEKRDKEEEEDSVDEDVLAEAEALADEPLDPVKCPECHLRLAKNQESCPRCLQKGKIMGRVWELLAPHWRGGLMVVVLTMIGIMAELVPPKLQQ